MELPFTVEQFYGVLRACNAAVWPAQRIIVALALGALRGALVGSVSQAVLHTSTVGHCGQAR